MPFDITLAFVKEQDRDAFVERAAPRIRGQVAALEEPEATEDSLLHRACVSVTSQSAAKDVCHVALGFLAHAKNMRIVFSWPGVGGEEQYGEVNAGEARDADLIAMRLGAAAKAFLDAEKADQAASAPASEE